MTTTAPTSPVRPTSLDLQVPAGPISASLERQIGSLLEVTVPAGKTQAGLVLLTADGRTVSGGIAYKRRTDTGTEWTLGATAKHVLGGDTAGTLALKWSK